MVVDDGDPEKVVRILPQAWGLVLAGVPPGSLGRVGFSFSRAPPLCAPLRPPLRAEEGRRWSMTRRAIREDDIGCEAARVGRVSNRQGCSRGLRRSQSSVITTRIIERFSRRGSAQQTPSSGT